MMLGVQHIIME